jgi:hypothetical protein
METKKRKIYSVSFNKRFTETGEVRATTYTVGQPSVYFSKVPESIVIEQDNVVVTFADQSRHIFPLTGVEIFDKPLDEIIKEKKNVRTKNTDK